MAEQLINLENLEHPCPLENNMSGVYELYIIPRSDVERINATRPQLLKKMEDFVVIGNPKMKSKAITVKSGKEFITIKGCDEFGTLTYSHTSNAMGCRSTQSKLQIRHPGFKEKLLAFFSITNNTDFVAIVLLENGSYHLLGNQHRGITLADDSNVTSGKLVTDFNGADLTFIYSDTTPKIFYTGWSPEDPNVGVELFRIINILSSDGSTLITTNDGRPIEVNI